MFYNTVPIRGDENIPLYDKYPSCFDERAELIDIDLQFHNPQAGLWQFWPMTAAIGRDVPFKYNIDSKPGGVMSGRASVITAAMALLFSGTALATIHQVDISNFVFVPGDQTIDQGDTVQWTNQDAVNHTSTSDNGVWDSGLIAPTQSYSFAFADTGTFPYHCSIHLSMVDTIRVRTAADWTINIGDFFFDPAVIQIQPGQTVRWMNNGSRIHTSTSDDGYWNSDSIAPGEYYDHLFADEGVFHYHCELHPLIMLGTVIVGQPESVAYDIQILDFAFSPAETTINVGQNVRWINFGPSEHTTTDTSANLWDSGVLSPGYAFTYHADQPGTFYYICTIHPQMTGTLTVLDTASSPGCNYVIGDINGNGIANGLDVVYGVSYFKGGAPPPYSCDCPPHGTFFVASDVNGSCSFNGLDITYYVAYLKGGPALQACPNCPPGD
jgi:plastocyanin